MRTACALLTAVLLALAGCGGDDTSLEDAAEIEQRLEAEKQKQRFEALLRARAEEQRRRQAGEEVPEPPADFDRQEAARWSFDRLVCSSLPASELAQDLELDEDTEPEEIARAYSKSWPGEYRRPSYAGCLAGLEDPLETAD